VFLNLKRTHEDGKQTPPYINNSLLISSLLFGFVEKENLHGNMGTYFQWRAWRALRAECCRVLLLGRSLKIHIEFLKRELFTVPCRFGWLPNIG